MNIFIVLAHPEPASLTHTLKNITVYILRKAGHEIIVSDLYARNQLESVCRWQ